MVQVNVKAGDYLSQAEYSTTNSLEDQNTYIIIG